MPIVKVLMYGGRTQQQKDDLARAITDAVESIAKAPRDQTIVAFMSQLDGNIVLIALPTITRSLNASAFEALWVLMGYILMTAVLLLAFGRLADMYGKVRLYNLGFAVFTIGSGLCSLSITG